MNQSLLDSAFQTFRSIPFPEFAESDELSDWQAALAEIDGHIAGIASSRLLGAYVDTKSLPKCIADFRIQLNAIGSVPEVDQAILASCKKYLDALENVVRALQER